MPQRNQSAPSYLAIGRVTAPHGIRGEVKVEVLTDFPEASSRPSACTWVQARTTQPPGPSSS